MGNDSKLIVLQDASGALAWIRPDLGGWLLRYARPMGAAGLVEGIYYEQAVVDRYPKEMWAGNPLLFPHVSINTAKGIEGQYELNGQIFTSPIHGFGRRLPWRVAEQSAFSVTLELSEGPGTMPSYPFRFRHRFTYRLTEGRLEMHQEIENTDSQPLPFSTGIHPYIPVPLGKNGERGECVVRLPRCTRYNPIGKFEDYFTEPMSGQEWPVSRDVSGTLLLGDFAEKELSLVHRAAGVEVVVNFSGAPQYRYAAVWSRTTESPFYCLEPWTALPNSFGRPNGELVILPPGERFDAHLWMEIRVAK